VFTRRPLPTDSWFDRECRDAKRTTQRLERAFASASRRAASAVAAPLDGTASGVTATAAIAKAVAAKAAWYNQRRLYRQLWRDKCSDYWRDKLKADQAYPQRLWKSVDSLLLHVTVVNRLARQLTSH